MSNTNTSTLIENGLRKDFIDAISNNRTKTGDSLLQCVLNIGYDKWNEKNEQYPVPTCQSVTGDDYYVDWEEDLTKEQYDEYTKQWNAHEENHWRYEDMLFYMETKYGGFARLVIQVAKLVQQVENGGISQYYCNDYTKNGLHAKMCELWDECIDVNKETAVASKFRRAINYYNIFIMDDGHGYNFGGHNKNIENRIDDNNPLDFLTDLIRIMWFETQVGKDSDNV